jgi:hypothetical protein
MVHHILVVMAVMEVHLAFQVHQLHTQVAEVVQLQEGRQTG